MKPIDDNVLFEPFPNPFPKFNVLIWSPHIFVSNEKRVTESTYDEF